MKLVYESASDKRTRKSISSLVRSQARPSSGSPGINSLDSCESSVACKPRPESFPVTIVSILQRPNEFARPSIELSITMHK